ncbi:MAG: M48 family metalloprotease [Cocleimonas sp.]
MSFSVLLSNKFFKKQFKIIRNGILAFAVLSIVGCSTNPVTGKKDFSLINKDQELAMGKQAHNGIMKQKKRLNNAKIQAYVNNIGQQLARQSHRKDLRYTFTVLDDPSVNAFALPGGYIYITTGIMAYLNSEGELAGVLGHEIGHVTARHGVKQQSAGVASSILLSVLAKQAGGSGKEFGNLNKAILSGYGRDHELQADRLGAEYLARIGFSPKNMTDVVGVLKSQEEFAKVQARREGRQPRAYHGVFASHPRNDTRLQKIIAEANKYKKGATRDAGHNRYLNMIAGLKYRIDKKNTGRIVVGNVKNRSVTYASLAKQSRVNEQRLRLLNGMFPNGQPVQGRLIKIIQ